MKLLLRVCLFMLLFSFGFLTFPLSSSAQEVEAWTDLGLYGGQIYDIAIDPSNPDKMFAGSYFGSGLFMTTDGGNSWQAVIAAETVQGEDTFKNHAVWAVKITPGNPNVIWAAHNYWVEKSTDGGKTWTHTWNGWMQSSNYGTCQNCPIWDQYRFCLSLAIDPSDPEGNTIFVGTSGRYTNWTPYGAIYMTEDGGDNWRKLKGPVYDEPGPYTDPEDPGNFDYDVVDLSIDTSNPDVIVLWAVTRGDGIFIEKAGPEDTVADGTLYRGEINRSTGAETWTEIFSMEGGKFWDVEVKPNDPNSIFTANDWGVFRHYFEEGEWKYQWILNFSGAEPSPGAVFARNVSALAFDPKNPDILYAAWKNNISQWENIDTGSKVARGTLPYEDANWEIYTSGYQFEALTVHPENSEVILGGEFYQGVYKSQNHGQSWTPVNNGINAIIVRDVEVDPHDAKHLLAGTFVGVYEKRAAGDWILTSDFENTDVRSVAFDPTDTDGSTYYAGLERRLAKTTNSGADWTFSDYLPQGEVNDIAVGSGGNTVFITTHAGGSVYKSENALATPTLTQVLSSDEFAFNVVAIDPNDPDHIFAGGGNFFGTKVLGNLYESTTGGDAGTWHLTGLTDVIVNALLIDPRDSNIMYAGCGWSGATDVPVYKSSDRGVTWTPSFEGIPGNPLPARAMWGSSATDIFVVGDHSILNSDKALILHYDGFAWTVMDSGTIEDLFAVWGASESDVFAVGTNGTILYYDGSNWSAMESETSEKLTDVWGSAHDNVFAVGNNGTMLHYNGSAWTTMNSGTAENLWGVWGSSAMDVFAVGENGTILHYTGDTWSAMNSSTTEHLYDVWGSSGTDIFAVGENGTILHYNGSTWSKMSSGTTKVLADVWGSSGTNVFVVGFDKTILHYDGRDWTNMDSSITDDTEDIESVWGFSGTDVFAVAFFGSVIHYNGESWTLMKPGGKNYNSVTDLEFHRENKDVIYASTSQQGVYVSPNQAENWLNLGTPEFLVLAISTSSLYAATEGGLLQCTGTGVIAGNITDAPTGSGIDGASVHTDLGNQCTSVAGEYMMVCPSGIFDVMATADDHANQTMEDVTVLGGDVSWAHFDMQPGESGYMVTPDLWIRSVINTEEKGPIVAVWEKGGEGTTSRGDRVIWGHFYANPSDVTWGSANNPDLFVKIWFDVSGRVDVNWFHLSVPDIEVYSDYPYDETTDERGTTTMSRRYIRQWYKDGQSHSEENFEDGMPAAGYSPEGNPSGVSTINDLKIGSIINTVEKGPIDAIWSLGGHGTTSRGDQVVWGHFYANPSDVSWGSENNPDLFVKIWFDVSGRVDVNFMFVSVPDIEVYSDFPSDGTYDHQGTTILKDRYIRYEYWR